MYATLAVTSSIAGALIGLALLYLDKRLKSRWELAAVGLVLFSVTTITLAALFVNIYN